MEHQQAGGELERPHRDGGLISRLNAPEEISSDTILTIGPWWTSFMWKGSTQGRTVSTT
jgi:hypothetical protein